MSPSICWRDVLVVIINTMTAITIGILQKIPSLPLCLNPICSPFLCLIKASKNGSASFSLPLIRYLHDRDDMKTGEGGKEAEARIPGLRGLLAVLLCGNAEAITCFPSVLRANGSVPDIQKRRLTVGKQTYEEILQRTNELSFHLSRTTMLRGEI